MTNSPNIIVILSRIPGNPGGPLGPLTAVPPGRQSWSCGCHYLCVHRISSRQHESGGYQCPAGGESRGEVSEQEMAVGQEHARSRARGPLIGRPGRGACGLEAASLSAVGNGDRANESRSNECECVRTKGVWDHEGSATIRSRCGGDDCAVGGAGGG